MSNPRAATSVHRRTPASNKNVEHKKAQEIGGGCYLRYKIQRKCWFVSVAFAFPNGYLELILTKEMAYVKVEHRDVYVIQ